MMAAERIMAGPSADRPAGRWLDELAALWWRAV